MATDFVSRSDAALDNWDATAFVRWSGNANTGEGTAFEFGTVSNFERVRRLLELGETFLGLGSGELNSRDELDQLLVDGRVTFGAFPVTVALGSGVAFQFTVED